MRWTFTDWAPREGGRESRTITLEEGGKVYSKSVLADPDLKVYATLKMCKEAFLDALYDQHPELFKKAS